MKFFLKDINKDIILTATVTTPRVKLSIMMLSFTLEFLRLCFPAASFYILMYISGGVIGKTRGSFCSCHKMIVHGSKVISVWVLLSWCYCTTMSPT